MSLFPMREDGYYFILRTQMQQIMEVAVINHFNFITCTEVEELWVTSLNAEGFFFF